MCPTVGEELKHLIRDTGIFVDLLAAAPVLALVVPWILIDRRICHIADDTGPVSKNFVSDQPIYIEAIKIVVKRHAHHVRERFRKRTGLASILEPLIIISLKGMSPLVGKHFGACGHGSPSLTRHNADTHAIPENVVGGIVSKICLGGIGLGVIVNIDRKVHVCAIIQVAVSQRQVIPHPVINATTVGVSIHSHRIVIPRVIVRRGIAVCYPVAQVVRPWEFRRNIIMRGDRLVCAHIPRVSLQIVAGGFPFTSVIR